MQLQRSGRSPWQRLNQPTPSLAKVSHEPLLARILGPVCLKEGPLAGEDPGNEG